MDSNACKLNYYVLEYWGHGTGQSQEQFIFGYSTSVEEGEAWRTMEKNYFC